jgi:hypothetical protein
MKTGQWNILIGILPLLIGIQGCLDETVKTTIASDGSSERVISMKRPSQSLPANAFPVIPDSGWTVTWTNNPADTSNPYECLAVKRFASPEALEREYSALPDTGVMRIELRLKKSFRWFYTYIDYQETYRYRDPFGHVPVTDFLSPDELRAVAGGSEADSLGKKLERWQGRNYFEEVYRPVDDEIRRRNDPRFPAERFERAKEQMFAAMLLEDSVKKSQNNKQHLAAANGDTANAGKQTGKGGSLSGSEDVLRWLENFFGTKAVNALAPAVDAGLNSLEKKEARIKHPDTWTNIVQMPGLILSANGSAIEGNTVTWKFKPKQLEVADYRMSATSRVTNTWAFVVSGMMALGFLLIVIMGLFRGGRSSG